MTTWRPQGLERSEGNVQIGHVLKGLKKADDAESASRAWLSREVGD